MAWPPPTLPVTRTNTTVMADTHPADHNAVNLAVNDIVGFVKPSAWTAVTFQNSWVNAAVGTNTPTQYRKLGDNVQVRISASGGSSGTVAFTLPTGFRPPLNVIQGADGGGGHAQVTVTAAGSVVLLGAGVIGAQVMFSTVT